MGASAGEMQALLNGGQTNESSADCSLKEMVSTGLKIATAIPRGASALYGAFGQAAIHYDKRGFWVLGPVGAGALACVSNEGMAILARFFPDNKVFQILNKGIFFVDHGLVEFCAHFGMAWDIMTTIGINIAGVEVATNQFGNFYAPLISSMLAVPATYVSNQTEKTPVKRSYLRHFGEGLRGLAVPGGILGILSQQSILSPDSSIPLMVAVAGAGVGLLSSGLREHSPGFSRFCDTMIELCFNLSLMASQFNLCMSIVAAANNNEIPESVFYPNLALTVFFYLLLIGNTLFDKIPCAKPQTASISEVTDDEPNEEGYSESDEVDLEQGVMNEQKDPQVPVQPKKVSRISEALGALGVFNKASGETGKDIENPNTLNVSIN